jgi:hypothetical protein
LVDRSGVDPAPSIPDRRQQVFRRMQHLGHGRQLEQPNRALQGVHGAEGLVDGGAVVRIALKLEQGVAALLHQFGSLDQELGQQFVHQFRSGR